MPTYQGYYFGDEIKSPAQSQHGSGSHTPTGPAQPGSELRPPTPTSTPTSGDINASPNTNLMTSSATLRAYKM